MENLEPNLSPTSRTSVTKSKMQLTADLGCEFWNDSCALNELTEAVANGAVGATSNPVIVFNVVKADAKTWTPVIDQIVQKNPSATEDEVAWELIEEIGRRAAQILMPAYEKSAKKRGFLSMQVNPKFYRDARRMYEHGKKLASIAPNIAIKAPCTKAGIEAMENLVADGINVNATVSFSVSQAVAVAEAIERGIKRAEAAGVAGSHLHPYVTIMVGRVDDHIQRVMNKEAVSVDPGVVHWAGVSVFKKAHQVFKARGFRARLLAAAYRHHMHWSQLIGSDVLMTIPYSWWKQFNASSITPRLSLETPIHREIIEALYSNFADFRKAYDEGAMSPEEFSAYGATVHTLNQFLTGYQDLLGFVRERMNR